MPFNEVNTVEAHLRDLLAGAASARPAQLAPRLARASGKIAGLGWHYVAPDDLPRQPQEVLTEAHLRDALIRLNPDIAANPGRADEFNIVSKPNDWSRSVAQAARTIDEAELSDTRVKQRAYWAAFHQALDQAAGPVSGGRKPQPQSWMGYSIGRTGFNLGAVMIRPKRQIRTELYIAGDQAKAFFHLLREQQQAIEQELGYPLEWEELPTRRDSRISVYITNVDPEDKRNWPRQHEWLAAKINDFHRVFLARVRDLDAEDWQQDGEVGVSAGVSRIPG